jgi:hypothetical protein
MQCPQSESGNAHIPPHVPYNLVVDFDYVKLSAPGRTDALAGTWRVWSWASFMKNY